MTPLSHFDGTRWTVRADSLADALSCTVSLPAAGEASIVVSPSPSGTVLVEFSCSSVADITAGAGLFVPAAGLGTNGIVSALTLDTVPSTVTAIRLTASAAGARVEVAQ